MQTNIPHDVVGGGIAEIRGVGNPQFVGYLALVEVID